MENKRFIRTKEDFTCEHCGTLVRGTGYTNHCPECLWSKHVDVNPGDRAADCGGMMEPVGVESKEGEFVIVQKCTKCDHVRRNKKEDVDNMESYIEIGAG